MKPTLNLIAALLLLISTVIQAQTFVTIPDANFANWLNENYPDCMDGNQMNIDCPQVLNAQSINVSQKQIADLTGIEYFSDLKTLNCSFNQLSFLPPLPDGLTILTCYSNQLSTLPVLPATLKNLDCGFNPDLVVFEPWPPTLHSLTLSSQAFQLSDFPPLPNSLENLTLRNCGLTELPPLPPNLDLLLCQGNFLSAPPVLPTTITRLTLDNCGLSALPDPLPPGLTQLTCNYNNLTHLPELPSSLEILHCMNNQLNTLPNLPNALVTLLTNNNPLESLPTLPVNLNHLDCSNNQLTELPEITSPLKILICPGNLLTALPPLPEGLIQLNCPNNQISCFPKLPSSLVGIIIDDNPFTCLPNYLPNMQFNGLLDYPLCEDDDLTNNPLGCTSAKGVGGIVFNDDEADCELNPNNTRLTNIPFQLLDTQDELVTSTWSLTEGQYFLGTDTHTYTLRIDTADKPFQAACLQPGTDTILTFSSGNEYMPNLNFGLECKPGFDVGVRSCSRDGWVFPGQTHTLHILAGDLSAWYGLNCASSIGGNVHVTVSGPVTYAGHAPGALAPTQISPLEFEYTIGDFGSVSMYHDFKLLLQTDTSAQAGEEVCVHVSVDPLAGDQNTNNNSYYLCYPVVNSYDPNIKEVWPETVEVGYDDYFYYTIYFQNTGNAPAFNIRLADTLDSQLDVRTFEVLHFSHPCIAYLQGHILSFRFNDIMLPDSLSDPEGSIGFVQYRIKGKPDLPAGSIIRNTAFIYFDFNEPIVTNTTETPFKLLTGTVETQPIATLHAFPNPGHGVFQLSWAEAPEGNSFIIDVFNMKGERIMWFSTGVAQWEVNLGSAAPGLYLVRARSGNSIAMTKVVRVP